MEKARAGAVLLVHDLTVLQSRELQANGQWYVNLLHSTAVELSKVSTVRTDT